MMSSKRSVILSKFIFRRCFHTTQIRRIDPKTVEEIKIPVPWGHIAGKWWGKKSIQPVIAVHGWQDNANSWDPIAELLPDDFSILAIDFPGHGKSSHLPTFQNFYLPDAVTVIRRIKRHFEWDELEFLGHSGGSTMCFLYAMVFSEDVKSVFGIDYLIDCNIDEKKKASSLGALIDKRIELGLRDHSSSRRYSWEEAKEVWIKSSIFSLNVKNVEILIKRAVDKMPDGKYIFSRDHRLKGVDLYAFNPEQVNKLASNIRCEVCLVRATKSTVFDKGIRCCPGVLDVIKKKAKSYKFYDMDGNHYLHMDNPEKIVPLLVELFNQKL